MEASLIAKSTCFDESIAEYTELHHLSVEAWSQREKHLTEAWIALGKAEFRAIKVEKVLGEAQARVVGVEVRAQVIEEALGEAKDQALATKEEARVAKAWAFKET